MITTINNLKSIIKQERKKGKIIITTNGVFDILHKAHILYLEKAKSLGDILIVGVNADKSVKLFKDKKRPIQDERQRALLVDSLKSVDYVFIFNERDPCKFLKELKPDVHVKGGDYKTEDIIERKVLGELGIKLVLIKKIKSDSTTSIIRRIQKKYS